MVGTRSKMRGIGTISCSRLLTRSCFAFLCVTFAPLRLCGEDVVVQTTGGLSCGKWFLNWRTAFASSISIFSCRKIAISLIQEPRSLGSL